MLTNFLNTIVNDFSFMNLNSGVFNYYFKVVLEVIDFVFPNQAYTQFLAFFHPVTFITFFILCVLTLYMPHIPFC